MHVARDPFLVDGGMWRGMCLVFKHERCLRYAKKSILIASEDFTAVGQTRASRIAVPLQTFVQVQLSYDDHASPIMTTSSTQSLAQQQHC
jgi:hypothetical protein